MLERPGRVAILGAGTMGAGIAQVAAVAGWEVHLKDLDESLARAAAEGVVARLDRLLVKGRLAKHERDAAVARLHPVSVVDEGFADCVLLIEAVVESLPAKVAAIGSALERLPDDAVVASNTSSLSIGDLGDALGCPQRVVGMHFFNPAPLMNLVEVIAGARTLPTVVERAVAIAESFGKVVARATDVPGFIVNHVARPYYLEAFRILEEGLADPPSIDAAMKSIGGFRMGPLELTDLIGQDVNTATTRQVWSRLDEPPLLAPNALQESLVAAGHLGRKSGRGVYDYSSDTPRSAVTIERSVEKPSERLLDAVEAFVAAATGTPGRTIAHLIFSRVLLALITQAAHAEARGVATRGDIDTALRHGVNYPEGPFAWRDKIGLERCAALAASLNDRRFEGPPTRHDHREPEPS